jgi:hypothetical protein
VEKSELAAQAGITVKQLSIWFTNARKRIWVPLRQRQGKAAPTYLDSCLQRKLECTQEGVDGYAGAGVGAGAGATAAGGGGTSAAPMPPPLAGTHSLAELEAASVALHAQKEHLKAMLLDIEQQEQRVRAAAAAIMH